MHHCTFSILFWLQKNKIKNGKAPIMARVTINGQRKEISTNRQASPYEWHPKAQTVLSKTQEAKDTNNHLAVVKTKLLACQTKIEARGETLTAEAIKNEYTGVRTERKKIIEAFQFWQQRLKKLVEEKKRSQATYNKYDDALQHLKNFILYQYKMQDKYLDELSYAFMSDFEFYLSTTKGLSNNTLMKYISQTKTIFKMAQERGWLTVNPVSSFSCTFTWNDPLRLEMHELKEIYQKPLRSARLAEIRDTYVFMCYTGFAYIDAFQLTQDNIFWGIDKQKWVARDRQKTDGTECVPLLSVPLQILEKYKDHPACRNRNKLLPINSNQRFNACLKEIAAICGINKELTTHTARYTFATTVTLENNVPMETVGKMLGHSSIKSTQRYARVTRKKISDNMNELRKKLEEPSTTGQLKVGTAL